MKTAKTQILLTVMTAVFLTAAFSEGAGAATFDVTTEANSGAGSLRQAISHANANDEADVINIAPAVKEIYLSNAVEITGDVVVNGGGATVRGSKVSRLFGIAGGTVKFDRLTFTDGYPLSDSGGVAYIDSSAAAAAFVNCTFFGNRAGKSGGAVYLYGGGNRPTTFVNCTLTNNEAAESGGGVAILGGTVQFDASIITGNRAPSDPEIHRGSNGHVSNLGQYNVVGQTSVQDVFSTISNNVSVPASDVFKTPGLLGTVDGVQVVELNTNNVALDKIPIANALSLPSVDERGVPRPQMGAIDAGAYELSPVALASVDLRGVSYIEVLGSENFAAVPQPENATLDVRTYRNGLSWSVINPSNAEVLSVDQGGAVAALAEGVATLKVEAYGWDVSGNKIVRENSKIIKVGAVPSIPPDVELELLNGKTQMAVNDQHDLQIRLRVQPEETPYAVKFESVNPTVASVTQANSTSTNAIVKALYPGETMINVTVSARNSKGETSIPRGYLLTVVERKESGGGGGCQSLSGLAGIVGFVGTLAGTLVGGLMLRRRSRR